MKVTIKELLGKKTTWAGLVLIVTGIGQYFSEGAALTQALQTVLEGCGLIFLRLAVAKGR